MKPSAGWTIWDLGEIERPGSGLVLHDAGDLHGTPHYTLTGLTAATTYYITATAYNTSGLESTYSNEVVFNSPL